MPTTTFTHRRPVNDTKPEGYVAAGTYKLGGDACRILSVSPDGGLHNRVVLFDTVGMAQQFLPILGDGRDSKWSKDGESLFWLEIDPKGFSRADILTAYDPYNVPVGMPGGIRSETRGKEWKHHIMFTHAFLDCGQFVKGPDGTLINTALLP